MTTIGFIGGGNMAEALIRGVIAADVCSPGDVLVFDIQHKRLDYLSTEYKITSADSNAALLAGADIVVLSVKPQNMDDVLDEIKGAVRKNTLIISIAAALILRLLAEQPVVLIGSAAVVPMSQ